MEWPSNCRTRYSLVVALCLEDFFALFAKNTLGMLLFFCNGSKKKIFDGGVGFYLLEIRGYSCHLLVTRNACIFNCMHCLFLF